MTKLSEEKWDFYLDWLFDFEYNLLEIPKPDCVVFLDMPVEVSQKLLLKRYNNDESKKDVHESDVEYLKNCHKAAKYAAKKLGWSVVSCVKDNEIRTIDDIAKEVYALIEKELLNA